MKKNFFAGNRVMNPDLKKFGYPEISGSDTGSGYPGSFSNPNQ